MRNTLTQFIGAGAVAGALAIVTGCQTDKPSSTTAAPTAAPAVVPAAIVTPAAAPAAALPSAAAAGSVIRIKAGSFEPCKDSAGNVWQPEVGFEGGDIADRPDATIANTQDQGLYRSEHYAMDAFSCKVPNGKYVAKLHFAETFEGINGPGERVFSFNVQGREFKDFDVWAKAGGPNKAYVETVPVEVTNGQFKIVFTPNIENPQINAIELSPQL